jgi:hypothetical protein
MIGKALVREGARIRSTKLLMLCIFVAGAGANLPACTSMDFLTAMNSTAKTEAADQPAQKQTTSSTESTAKSGNWGYAPGNGTDPDDQWSRSQGILETTSPGCPFKFC